VGETKYTIEVSDLVKDFRVYHRSYGSIKSHAAAVAKSLLLGRTHGEYDLRRALDHVSFNVSPGEVLAVVGRNGSGKSTLLSILARVYLPTAGEARIRGRVVGLLELGAGFHQELTGIENVFFNGAVLGLTDTQIADRLDSIVAFAELDAQAMDLPVRMYSSGMQLRLAFALAAHLDEEILLVDEGLAVGDQTFQQKCIARMEEFKKDGRTILLVTHTLWHVDRIADRVIWLDKGRIKMEGDVKEVMAAYREEMGTLVPVPVTRDG
jgi:ABC-type polysaccharide/polyol phosphate transport system ATPase subunit